MDDLECILSNPKLLHFIESGPWKRNYSIEQFADAAYLCSQSEHLPMQIEQNDYTGAIEVLGAFPSSEDVPLVAGIMFLEEDYEWSALTDCECDIGCHCHHSLAVMVKLTKIIHQYAEDQTAMEATNPSLLLWIDELKYLAEEEPPKQTTSKPNNQFIAYCLFFADPEYEDEEDCLTLHLGRKLKNGTFINTASTPSADPERPAKYMLTEDFYPCALYRKSIRYTYDDSLSIKGENVSEIIAAAIKFKRLYLTTHSKTSKQPAIPIILGKKLKPKLQWSPNKDESLTPSTNFPETGKILECDPPYFLDIEKNTLHPIDTESITSKMLFHWIDGPTIGNEVVKDISPFLRDIKLPPPKAIKKKSLQKSTPTPSLRLFRKNPFNHAGLHLAGYPEPIIGELTFTYHGHQLKPDLLNTSKQKSSFTVVESNTVLEIYRDPIAELDLIQELINEGKIAPIATQHDELNENLQSCFLPMSEPTSWDMSWALFISTIAPTLRKNGWEITIEDESNIEFHTIGEDDLDTGIEDLPSHGIDWFQFKASYITPSGKKASLLPILSRLLEDYGIDHINEQLALIKEDKTSVIEDPASGLFISINAKQMLTLAKNIHELFGQDSPENPLHRIQAADVADTLELDSSQTLRDLAKLGNNLKHITTLPKPKVPLSVKAELRSYQLDGFHWLQFLARYSLHGILADDMGLGKTLQTLTHIQAEVSSGQYHSRPSLVIAPTSVVGNWKAEAKKFTPDLKVLLFHGADRQDKVDEISDYDLILTTYGLLVRDFDTLNQHDFHILALDEAQYIKNPVSKASKQACKLRANHRISLSGTPIENHLGELWTQMRFLMPGILGSQEAFRKSFRTPIEKHHDRKAQASLNRRIAPLILRRTKDEVATELPPKTHIVHTIPLNDPQVDVYETVRAVMDERIRHAITEKGLAKSQIIVLDALLKLRQICCHPQLLKLPAAQKINHSAKLDFLTTDLLPTLIEEGRKILLFSSFTSMLDLIEEHLKKEKIKYAKIVGKTLKRQDQVQTFQEGDAQLFLISLKAGGTGLNLTAADTVIHYDPWWNPAAENQATDRAHRIGQTKPVFVHKLISEGTIEQRIQELQAQKAALVDALLTADTTKLKMDKETLHNLLAPIDQ